MLKNFAQPFANAKSVARFNNLPNVTVNRNASTEVAKKPRKTAAPAIAKPKARKTPPGSISAYSLFIQKFAQERKAAGEKYLLQNAVDAYKALPESEKQKLVEQIPELISQRRAVYDDFVSKMSPAEILEENKTRAALRKERLASGKSVRNLAPILDQNAPTRPLSSFLLYCGENRGSGEFVGMTVTEQARALGERWRSLGEAEKQRYKDQAQREKAEYEVKKKAYYG